MTRDYIDRPAPDPEPPSVSYEEATEDPSRVTRLADDLATARVNYDAAQDLANTLKERYDAIEANLFDVMEGAGLQSIRTERGLFRLNDLAWAKIEDPEAAKAWADDHMPELLTLNSARLSKVVRDALKGDVPIEGAVPGTGLMPGVGFSLTRKITWRRQ
jgi:hypothetical protein